MILGSYAPRIWLQYLHSHKSASKITKEVSVCDCARVLHEPLVRLSLKGLQFYRVRHILAWIVSASSFKDPLCHLRLLQWYLYAAVFTFSKKAKALDKTISFNLSKLFFCDINNPFWCICFLFYALCRFLFTD